MDFEVGDLVKYTGRSGPLYSRGIGIVLEKIEHGPFSMNCRVFWAQSLMEGWYRNYEIEKLQIAEERTNDEERE